MSTLLTIQVVVSENGQISADGLRTGYGNGIIRDHQEDNIRRQAHGSRHFEGGRTRARTQADGAPMTCRLFTPLGLLYSGRAYTPDQGSHSRNI